MKIFVITICSLALATGAYSAQQDENKQKKKQPQTVQHAPATTAHPTGHPTGAGGHPPHTSMEAYHGQQGTYHGQHATYHGQQGTYHAQKGTYHAQQDIKGHPSTEAYHGQKVNNAAAATANAGKHFKPQHYDFSNKPNPKIQSVKFENNYRIKGAENWKGDRYAVFRNYHSEWHDQGWWHNHYNRVVFISGGWYAWNGGWWLPAWGYAPNAYYAYDGPIYGYNSLPPDQVIANVQSALQQQGYYQGEVDGLLGPQTRGAIADYQRANGLEETAAIDQPTLESLGMS